MAQEWAAGPGVILFCGRFEGLDERVIEARGMQEVAVGEAVLAGGEAAAMVLLEACVRLIPGVLGNEAPSSKRASATACLSIRNTHARASGRAAPSPTCSPQAITPRSKPGAASERERLTAQRRPDLKPAPATDAARHSSPPSLLCSRSLPPRRRAAATPDSRTRHARAIRACGGRIGHGAEAVEAACAGR